MGEVETRTYEITATKEQLDIIEAMFKTMKKMGTVGARRTFRLCVDGDGAFRPKFVKVPCYYEYEIIIPFNELCLISKVINDECINKGIIDETEIDYTSTPGECVKFTIRGRGITGMNLVTNIINKLTNNELQNIEQYKI